MHHSTRQPRAVDKILNSPLRLPSERWWAGLVARQVLIVARVKASSASVSPADQVADLVPPGCSFIMVDETQWADEVFAEHRPIPFLEKGGEYWGLPADDETAIRECERLRSAGAGFILFVPSTFWWLKHYVGFEHHLRSHYACVREDAHALRLISAAQGGQTFHPENILVIPRFVLGNPWLPDSQNSRWPSEFSLTERAKRLCWIL